MSTPNKNSPYSRRIAELERQLEKSKSQNNLKDKRIEADRHLIKKLRWRIDYLQRKLFGAGQGEKLSDDQLQLSFVELGKAFEALNELEGQLGKKEVAGYSRRKKKDRDAEPRIPDHLEEVEEVIIPEEVQADPEAWERIGEEVTEELGFEPPRFFKRKIIRPKYVRRTVTGRKPVVAKLPGRVIPRSKASAGLIAYIIVSKYCDHLPLYRQEKIFLQRQGVRVPRQRMCDWIGYVVDNYLSIIYRSIRQGLFKGDYIQIDETPIAYVQKGGMGKSRKGYFWVFGHPDGNVCFAWQLGRSQADAENALKGYGGGLMQSDGYSVYDRLSNQTGGVQLGCWAHARRKFFNAFELKQIEAAPYLRLIKELYRIERSLPEKSDEVLAMRREKSQPILDTIHELLHKDLPQRAEREDPLGEAIKYTLSQWPKLTAYLEHPQTRIDNNRAEQSIRPCKLGVKNWLFIGHPDAGHRSAVIYTLIESCKRQGVEPLAYITDLLERLPRMTNHEAEKLTPDKWKPPVWRKAV